MTARLAGFLSGNALDQNIALEKRPDDTYRPRSLSQAIEMLNEMVLDEMETEHYFTLMLADIDLTTGRVTVGQAGHPHPLVQRRSGEITQDGTGGFPVGLMSGISFDTFKLQLDPGDRLVILSDGFTECPNDAGDMLGEEGLASMLADLEDMSGPALCEALVWRLGDYAGTPDFPDDVSGLVFEYQPKAR
jgi:sigma-B regulation protein RsbU (phosphoserine phosphatase)